MVVKMIKKISREEVESLIKKHYGIKNIGYYRNHGHEGYGGAMVDFEFIEGEAEDLK